MKISIFNKRTQKFIAAIAAALFCLLGCISFTDPIPTTLTEEEFAEYSDLCTMLEQIIATEDDAEDAFNENLESIKAIDCVKDAMVSDGSALIIFENGSSIEYILNDEPVFVDDSGNAPVPEATKSSTDITKDIQNASAVVFDLFSEDKNRVAQSRLTKATASILGAVYVDFANFTTSNFLEAIKSEKCEFIVVSSHGSKSFLDAVHPELWTMDPYVSETGNKLAFGGTEAGIEALKNEKAHLAYDDFSKKYYQMKSLEELLHLTPYGRGLSITPKTIYFESCHTLTQPFDYDNLQVIGWTGKTKFSQAYGVILADYFYNFGLDLKALAEDFGKNGQITDPSYSSSKLVAKGGLADMQPFHRSGNRIDDYPYSLKGGWHWSFKYRKENGYIDYEIKKPEQGGRYSRKETDGTTISTKIFNNKYDEQRKSQGSSQNCFVEFTKYYDATYMGDVYTAPIHEVKELSFESGISYPEKILNYDDDDVHPGILRIISSDNREPRKSVNDCVYVFFSREFEANDIYVENDDEVNDNVTAVDLGLPSGLKWASCNLGATKPEDYGGYYQWGGTAGCDRHKHLS